MDVQGQMEGDPSGALALPVLVSGEVNAYEGQTDYIISDYMERLGTRLNILETELKYAWRALDLLSQEYIKMWERLERLEGLLCEQQGVIAHLLDFYTTERSNTTGRMGQLEVIREILGNGTVEDGLEEGVEATGATGRSLVDVVDIVPVELQMAVPDSDEAFYQSLNRAYREDLVNEPSRPPSQLDMIWEDPEDTEDPNKDEVRELLEQALEDERQEVFSAMDYKDYRGNSPCISERDLAQLSRLSSIDQIAIEKLHELDRLTTKLQKDSKELKELKSRLKSPQHIPHDVRDDKEVDSRTLVEDGNIIDEQLRQMYGDENWTFSSAPRGIDELMLLASTAPPASITTPVQQSNRSSSRLSIADSTLSTDKEVADAMAGSGFRSPNVVSPRHKYHKEKNLTTEPYTTVTGRLAYSSAVANAESHSKPPKSPGALSRDRMDMAYSYGDADFSNLYGSNYVPSHIPSESVIKGLEKPSSPTLSMHSVKSRQDKFLDKTDRLSIQLSDGRPHSSSSPSPPPPAPQDESEVFLMAENSLLPGPGPHRGPSPSYLIPTAQSTLSVQHEHGRLSPRSPKSSRTSPRHVKKDSTAIVPAKSDSGLSSMSGWSSIEKSPGSPKTTKSIPIPIANQHLRSHSPSQSNMHIYAEPRKYMESDTDSYLTTKRDVSQGSSNLLNYSIGFDNVTQPIENGLDAYSQYLQELSSSRNLEMNQREYQEKKQNSAYPENYYVNSQQPAIYSVAGSNQQQRFTSVYTSGTTNMSHNLNYPDNIEPYSEQNLLAGYTSQQRYPPEPNYRPQTSLHTPHGGSRKSLSRGYSVGSMPSEGLANHEGYRNAMQRTMFPSGNITDALSYYPTSSRQDNIPYNLPRKDYNDPSAWLTPEGSQLPHDSTSSSMDTTASMTSQTMANNMEYRKQFQNQLQQEYFRQQQQQQQREQYEQQNSHQPVYQNSQNFQRGDDGRNEQQRYWNQQQQYQQQMEQEMRNRGIPHGQHPGVRQHGDQYYDHTGLLVSQAGYVSISSDFKTQKAQEKSMKKPKRGSLKSAMSSVSQWLPDLHLPKRNRSLSLPSGVDRDDIEPQKEPKPSTRSRLVGSLSRKKKKYPLVATMSGILQKAKRKTHTSHQSLSDPETSENEWSGGRSSAQSEDSDSVFSDTPLDNTMFARIASSKKQRRLSQQEKMDQQQKIQQLQLQQHGQQYPKIQPQEPAPLFELVSKSQEKDDAQLKTMSPPRSEDGFPDSCETSPPQAMFAQIKKRHSKDRDTLSDGHKTEPETDFSDNAPGEEEGNKSSGSQSGSSSIFATMGEVKRREGSDESGGETRSFGKGGGSMEFAVSRALGKYRMRQSSSVSDDQICPDEQAPKTEDLAKLDETEEVIKEFPPEPPPIPEHKAKLPEIVNSSIDEPSPVPDGSPSTQSLRSHSNRFMPRHQQSLDVPFSRHEDDDNRSTHSWRSGSRVSSRRQSTEDSIDSEDEWYCYELRKLEEMERQSQMEMDRNEPLIEEPEFEKDVTPFEPDEDVKEKMSFVLQELRIRRKPIEGVLTSDDIKNEVVASAKRRNSRNQSPLTAPKNACVEFARVTDYHTWRYAEEAMEQEERERELAKEVHEPEPEPEPVESDIEEDDDDKGGDGGGSSGETSGPDSPGEQSADDLDEEPAPLPQPPPPKSEPTSPPSQKDGGPLGSKWKLLKTLKERKAEEKINQETQAAAAEKDKVSTSVSYLMQKFHEIRVKS